jgi:hypothetical protein
MRLLCHLPIAATIVLIIVGKVCQSKVPSSIITNGVSVGHSQAQYWFTHQSYQNGFGLFGMRLGAGALDATQQRRVI